MQRTKEHFPFLDTLRGIAILMVFLYHCLGIGFGHDQLTWGRNGLRSFAEPKTFLILLPLTLGWAGVAVFFVISGFCIHLSFLKGAASDWRGFFIRRFFRIYPPYLLALLFFALLFPITRLSLHARLDGAQFGSHILLLHNLDKRFFFGINPAFWSIALEAQLYLIYPLLIALTGRLGWQRTLLIACGLEVVLRGIAGSVSTTAIGEAPQWLSGSPFFSWFSWAIGAALADAFVHKRPLPLRSSSPFLWLSLAVGTYAVKPLALFPFLFFSLLTATVIAKRLERDQTVAAAAPSQSPVFVHLRRLGVWSYSFYLLHQPLIMAVPFILHRVGTPTLSPLFLFLTCASTYPFIALISWLYFTHCERHSIALGKWFLRPAKKGAAVSPAPAVAPDFLP